MSLVAQIQNLATRIGTECKAIRALTGSLSSLTTTNKSSVVAALNELKTAVNAAGAISDGTTTLSSVWSSTKTNAAINAAITALIGGAPGTLDTLKELADQLAADGNALSNLTTAIGNRLRFDAPQTLTAPQQAQGLANLGAVPAADIGNTETDFVATFNTAIA